MDGWTDGWMKWKRGKVGREVEGNEGCNGCTEGKGEVTACEEDGDVVGWTGGAAHHTKDGEGGAVTGVDQRRSVSPS